MKRLSAALMKIKECIETEEYGKAEMLLKEEIKIQKEYDDVTAILEGSLAACLGQKEREFTCITRGLQYNCKNYELYVMLGNFYLDKNMFQTYLCYENALLYCEEAQDKRQIEALLKQLKDEYCVSVPKTAIIILSYNLLEYTRQCVESIRQSTLESSREIILVDNASQDGSAVWIQEQKDIKYIINTENKGFPAGCNQGAGIAEADSDIFLLNNDTILTPNALFWLRMGLYEKETTGAVGSVSNYVSNGQQVAGEWKDIEEILAFSDKNNVPMKYPYEEKLFLIGFACLIKRKVWDEIGELDEIFSPGNSEDVDYGLRVLKAGYHNLLCRNSFILHFGSRSFGKLGNKFAEILLKNQKVLNAKWGMELQNYIYPKNEFCNLIMEDAENSICLLDIGCGCGVRMAKVKSEFPLAQVYGIEKDIKAAKLAGTIGEVLCGNVEILELPYPEEVFDYIIMDGVMEQLLEPEKVLHRLKNYMKKNGRIIVSISNIKHWSVLIPLLREDAFTYADEGIINKSHLRMYTGQEIQKLMVSSGYKIVRFLYGTNGEPKIEDKEILDCLLRYMEKPDIMSFAAYQYIVVATL